MSTDFKFTFAELENHFRKVLDNGYSVITCEDYLAYKASGGKNNILVNRVDIDFSLKKAKRIAAIFNKLDIRGTFFLLLHAHEYNPFAFEEYLSLKYIRDSGHEIGYHSEIEDQAAIWNEKADECLVRDISMLSTMLGVTIKGIASHRGMTGLNNLDFWKNRKPVDFGLLYEAYDQCPEFNLFNESFYISDSNWTSWKCYDRGILVTGDSRNLGEHSFDMHQIIYSLIHPETYYDIHFYE